MAKLAAFMNTLKTWIFPLTKKKLLAFGVAAVALVAAVVLVIVLIGGGYKAAVKNYTKALNGDFDKIEKLAPSVYWEYIAKTRDVSVEDVKTTYKRYYAMTERKNKAQYGENFKVSVQFEKKEVLPEKEVQACAAALKKGYGINPEQVKALYEVEFDTVIKGTKGKKAISQEMAFVKIGSKWYPIFFHMGEKDASVTFVAESLVGLVIK